MKNQRPRVAKLLAYDHYLVKERSRMWLQNPMPNCGDNMHPYEKMRSIIWGPREWPGQLISFIVPWKESASGGKAMKDLENFQIPGHLERETEFLYLWALNKMKSLLNVCEPPEESSKWKSRVLPPAWPNEPGSGCAKNLSGRKTFIFRSRTDLIGLQDLSWIVSFYWTQLKCP